MTSIGIWITTAALVVAIVLAIVTSKEQPEGAQLPEALADSPDLLMARATIVQYREDGTLSYRLIASELRHFDEDAITHLRDADLHVINELGDPPWDINARYGSINRQPLPDQGTQDVVHLRDEVKMEQQYPDGRFVRLETPAIDYYPERQYAETSRDVMIDTDVGRTRAVGLEGELQKGLLRLFSNDEERVHTIVLRSQFR
jgi:lipopolysaccharide export system protein LptC